MADHTPKIEGLFRANFWEDESQAVGEGFNVLNEKMMSGKETWLSLSAFCDKLSRVEEDYRKALANNLVKSTPLGKDEIGTARSAFRTIQGELSVAADVHHDLSVQLSKELSNGITETKDSQKEVRKKVFSEITKLKTDLDKAIKHCETLKSKYAQKTKEAIKLDKEFHAAESDKDCTPHVLSKIANKSYKCEKDVDVSESVYYEDVLKVRKLQVAFESKVGEGCDVFEQVEYERILELQQALTKLHDMLLSHVTPSLDSCDRLRDAFDGIAASVDVVEFCNLKRLGQLRPTPLHYEEVVQRRSKGNKKMPKRQNLTFFGQAEQVEASVDKPKEIQTAEEKLQSIIQNIKKEHKSRDGLEMMLSLYNDDPIRKAPVEAQLQEARIATLKDEKKKLQAELGLSAAVDEEVAPVSQPVDADGDGDDMRKHGVRQSSIICQVKALYPYDSTGSEELSLRVDDIIDVLECDDADGWWFGAVRGVSGLFPSSYVQRVN